MKILLTGASGFLGKEFLRLSNYKNNEIIKIYCNNEIKDGVYCNLNKASHVKDMLECLDYDIIVHLAANSSPIRPDEKSISNYTESIFNQTLYLLEYMKPGTRFIYCSSILALTRKCVYGKLKHCCENLIRSYMGDYYIVRPCAILGNELTHGVVKDILYKLTLPGDLQLINNSKKPVILSDEVIKYLDYGISNNYVYNEINCYPSDNISVEQIANIIMEYKGVKKNITFSKNYKDEIKFMNTFIENTSEYYLRKFLCEK